jgi:hypothetical protein
MLPHNIFMSISMNCLSRISDQSWGPSGLLICWYCRSLALKQLMHEADHSPLLELSAVLSVLSLNVFMVYTGISIPLSLFWRNDLNICMDVILSPRKWVQYGVMEQCAILQYCVVSRHRLWLSHDQCQTWKLGKFYACGFLFCVMLIYSLCLCPFHLL